MKLCVMGLGYIGLPTAIMFAKHGLSVHGVDINPLVVNSLKNKELHIEEPGLMPYLIEVLDAGNFDVSSQPIEADAYILSVPTPITAHRTANLDYVRNAAHMIVPYLKKGNLVVLESTVPPGTVENMLIPILKKTGHDIGTDLFVSYSPERVLPGNLIHELTHNDRIVGGINEKSKQMTIDLYKHFVKGTIRVTDPTTAEMVKLMENAYRDVNIAFANELARIAEKIGFNVWEAVDLANSHPRVHIHKPGPGVGGHCVAVDPWFIVEQAPLESRLITQARNINEFTPHHVVSQIYHLVHDMADPVLTLLGLTYKEDIDDMRESPSLIIAKAIQQKGYYVKMYDPYVKKSMDGRVDTWEEAVTGSDCVVILTGHEEFKRIDFNQMKNLLRTKMVLDTRNILKKDELESLGIKYIPIGSPGCR